MLRDADSLGRGLSGCRHPLLRGHRLPQKAPATSEEWVVAAGEAPTPRIKIPQPWRGGWWLATNPPTPDFLQKKIFFLFYSWDLVDLQRAGEVVAGDHGYPRDLDALPYALQKKYGLLRDLDKSLEDLKRQNEQRCEQEIEDIKRGIKSGSTLDISLLRFSDEALDEQKHSLRIADEKVALAAQAYEMVDQHIQQLDQYLKKFSEELRRETDFASGGVPASNHDVRSGKGAESGRGGRKK
ncbi:hypothetical protein CDL15_Pgr023864 [Punica granatum]|uniref:Inhibitor of growth protein N-terminal histone-binding domain-containing protein n=1 Tax=Punica granatum TaxID=22663 RepID=A0A218Y034_PUNGR|nr:hypothetical protein CDL15_Pgr023864 [Punica granatum]